MIVQAEEMAKAVRVAIDMNMSSDKLLADGDSDTLELDDVIYAKLADAVRMVETEAPVGLLESGHEFGSSVSWGESGKGWTLLPEDFMRLVVFKMSDWRRAVRSAITESDPAYSRQWSKRKGVCGNPERPVCAIVTRAEGRALEFFSCNSNTATVDQAVYVPLPHIDLDGGIDVSELCYRAAVYRAAALALASVGDQRSTDMMDISRSLLS